MRPELGPPDLEEIDYPDEDGSWERSGEHSPRAIDAGDAPSCSAGSPTRATRGRQIEAAYAGGAVRELSDAGDCR